MLDSVKRLVALMVLAVAASTAAAQYPNRPITVVVPFPAGTSSDIVTRIVSAEMSKGLGQPVVVVNRPGGNSAIGAASVASAAPDGYTLLVASAGTAALPALVKSLQFEPRDLTPISDMSRFVLYLYVNSDLPVKTLPELIDYARANPGKINYATGNPVGIVGTAQMLSFAGNPSMVHVPYKGEPDAVRDLVANRVQVMFAAPSSADAFVKAGKLRVLATNLPQRASFAPDVPSMNEYFPKFSVSAWTGLMGPKGLPKDIANRLSQEVIAAFELPQTKEKMERLQYVGAGSTPDAFAAFFEQQGDLYLRVLREAGVQPE